MITYEFFERKHSETHKSLYFRVFSDELQGLFDCIYHFVTTIGSFYFLSATTQDNEMIIFFHDDYHKNEASKIYELVKQYIALSLYKYIKTITPYNIPLTSSEANDECDYKTAYYNNKTDKLIDFMEIVNDFKPISEIKQAEDLKMFGGE